MLPLADTAKEKGGAYVTKLLIAANIAVFAWETWLRIARGAHAAAGFQGDYALVAQRLVRHPFDGPPWLAVGTHMFLHANFVHLLGNMWFLWIFGPNVEWRLGSLRYLLFYGFAGLAAAAAQVAVGPFSVVPMVGASGAISGVLGAYLVLFPTAFVWTLVPWIVPILPVPAVVFLGLWFVLQTYHGLGALLTGASGAGGVAWWAHAGGFVAGAAMTIYAKRAGWVRNK
jgi:membrane associated rhomboid family serine protease